MLKDYQMLTQQYNQAVQIYDQAVSTYDSMTGSRGFGMLHHSQNWIRLMPECAAGKLQPYFFGRLQCSRLASGRSTKA